MLRAPCWSAQLRKAHRHGCKPSRQARCRSPGGLDTRWLGEEQRRRGEPTKMDRSRCCCATQSQEDALMEQEAGAADRHPDLLTLVEIVCVDAFVDERGGPEGQGRIYRSTAFAAAAPARSPRPHGAGCRVR